MPAYRFLRQGKSFEQWVQKNPEWIKLLEKIDGQAEYYFREADVLLFGNMLGEKDTLGLVIVPSEKMGPEACTRAYTAMVHQWWGMTMKIFHPPMKWSMDR